MKQLRFTTIIFFSCAMLFAFTGNATASFSFDFTVNGQWADNLNNVASAELGDTIYLQYGWWNAPDTVTWEIQYAGESNWQTLTKYYLQPVQIYITGAHKVRLKVRRSYLFGLFFDDSAKEITLNLNVSPNSTKYPVFIVPGVNGFSKLDLLNAVFQKEWTTTPVLHMEYFFGVADRLREGNNQIVEDVSLSAWQNTKDRGILLKNRILCFLMEKDPTWFTQGKLKVNILAHSHGSTTARVAVAELAKYFQGLYPGETSARSGSRVASFTTVAGPHFGTPSADGAFKFRDMANANDTIDYNAGTQLYDRAKMLFKGLGVFVARLSGHNEYIDGRIPNPDPEEPYAVPNPELNWDKALKFMQFTPVAKGFTQREMYIFNKVTYRSEALPAGAKYLLSAEDKAYILAKHGKDISEAQINNDITNDPNKAYGANTTIQPGPIYGNGLGTRTAANHPHAIRYYSFSGWETYKSGWRHYWWGDRDVDMFDWALEIFNAFHVVVGQKWDDLPDCYRHMTLSGLDGANELLRTAWNTNPTFTSLYDAMEALEFTRQLAALDTCLQGKDQNRCHDMLDNNDIYAPDGTYGPRNGIGYTRKTDSFIPVDSAHFGEFLLDTSDPSNPKDYRWNHADEQNHLFGLLAEGAQNPVDVYKGHANRLKAAGY